MLTSVGLLENDISELQTSIENNIRLAIIPLKAYCKKFTVYLSLFNTNAATYAKLVNILNNNYYDIKIQITIILKYIIIISKGFLR